MDTFVNWFNADQNQDSVLKAAIAHLWFVTIHPFDDGNGRIGRSIADLQLARSDNSAQRFYSMSAQIQLERKQYYDILEKTQKGDLDITEWLVWFLSCLDRALTATDTILNTVLTKARYWEFFASKVINGRQKLMLNKLLDGFEGKLNTSKWAKITKVSNDTALRDILDLVNQGILEREDAGGRSTNYRFKNVSPSSPCNLSARSVELIDENSFIKCGASDRPPEKYAAAVGTMTFLKLRPIKRIQLTDLNNFVALSLTLLPKVLCFLNFSTIASRRVALASSYPSKTQPLKYKTSVPSFSSPCSPESSFSIILRILDFPLPQSPNTPIVTGSTASSLITSISKSACTLKPNKSSDVSLSAHIVV
jgi:prophage maintenance system killer protein